MIFRLTSGITVETSSTVAALIEGGAVSEYQVIPGSAEAALTAAVRSGDETAFTAIAGRHRRELLVHCYRMLGSLHDAEDAVQDAFLRAWRYRESLQEGAPLRPWLYRVATNACLDAIARDERRSVLAARAASEAGALPNPDEVAWLQPIPDSVLEQGSPGNADPEAIVLTRETIEIAFLTVIQLLTPQQRAALILRDILDWSAKETADLLEVSVAAANSALQRARATLREQLPPRRREWPADVDASAAERELLQKLVVASESADLHAFESIIREDAVFRMPPNPGIVAGREAMLSLWVEAGFGSEQYGRLRCVVTRANRQPAVANYLRSPGDTKWRALALDVFRIEEGVIAEGITFAPDVFPFFGLPLVMESQD
jgi:RNA polymerase sigma-70 factor, ECF subfamily